MTPLNPPSPSHRSQFDLGHLLDAIVDLTRRYIDMSFDQAVVSALHDAHTYTIEAADATPSLHVRSAEKRSGKTQYLELKSCFVKNPWYTGRVTPAVLIRKVERDAPTLLLDESDAAFKGDKDYSETLRGILNLGYRRGGVVSLCVKAGGDFDLRDFPVFCPKVIAGIGEMPDTIADRCIRITLQRKAPSVSVARFRFRDVNAETTPIREQLDRWAPQAVPALTDARPELPPELDDRSADVWEPLLAIADLAGGDWPQRARSAAKVLATGENREDASPGVQLLADIRRVFDQKGVDRLSSKYLVEALNALDDAPWGDLHGKPLDARGLGKKLKPYELKAKQVRFGEETDKGWELEDFADAWLRYLPARETSETQKHEPVEGLSEQEDFSETSAPSETPATERRFLVSHVSENPERGWRIDL